MWQQPSYNSYMIKEHSYDGCQWDAVPKPSLSTFSCLWVKTEVSKENLPLSMPRADEQTNLANNVYFVATQFTILDYSFGWILLFCLADENNRTKITRHTNDVYKLFTHAYVDTSNAYLLLSFLYVCMVNTIYLFSLWKHHVNLLLQSFWSVSSDLHQCQ